MIELFVLILIGAGAFFYYYDRRPKPAEPEPDIPPLRDPANPPSPEETKQASTQLLLALSLFDDALNTTDTMEHEFILERATRELMKVRALDPTATATNENGTYTMDEIAGMLLWAESRCLYLRHDQMRAKQETFFDGKGTHEENMRDVRSFDPYLEDYRRRMIPPAEQAVRYAPYRLSHLTNLALCYNCVGEKKKRDEIVQRMLAIDPHNIDTLKLKSGFR